MTITLEEINDRRLRMPESNNGPTKDEREMMSWVKKEYGLEDEKPSDLMRWSLQARHAVLKRDVQIGELKAEIERLGKELEETKRYWEECQIEHHKRNLECQRLRKVVDAVRGARNATDNEQFRRAMDVVAERMRELEESDV
jgi:regulator of replication initiation timing